MTHDDGGDASDAAYATVRDGLAFVHVALVGSFEKLAAGNVERAGPAARFLLAHHDGESLVLFPYLRKRTRLASTDVAFLDACERDHVVVKALCERLLTAAEAPHPSAGEIATLARAILDDLVPHVRAEEEGLAPERLRLVLTPSELQELGREQEAYRARSPRR